MSKNLNVKAQTLLNEIENKRQIILSLCYENNLLIEQLKNEIEKINNKFQKEGISQLARQLNDLRYEQCSSKNVDKKNELARRSYFIVAQIRSNKHKLKSFLKESGLILKNLIKELFSNIQDQLKEIRKEIKEIIILISNLVEIDSCILFLKEDKTQSSSILQIDSFFERMVILSLISSPSMLNAYADECIKILRSKPELRKTILAAQKNQENEKLNETDDMLLYLKIDKLNFFID